MRWWGRRGWSRRRRAAREHLGDAEIEFVGREGADGAVRGQVADPQRADLDDVAGLQRAFGRTGAVHEQPVPASEVADEDVLPFGRKLRVPARQKGVVVTQIAHRIATDDKPFDKQQLTFALPVVHDQHFAHRLRAFYSLFELSTSRRNRVFTP